MRTIEHVVALAQDVNLVSQVPVHTTAMERKAYNILERLVEAPFHFRNDEDRLRRYDALVSEARSCLGDAYRETGYQCPRG